MLTDGLQGPARCDLPLVNSPPFHLPSLVVVVVVVVSSLSSCDPMDCRLPGSSIHGILQAKILEWVAIPHWNPWPLVRALGKLPCRAHPCCQQFSPIMSFLSSLSHFLQAPPWIPFLYSTIYKVAHASSFSWALCLVLSHISSLK